MPIKSTKPRVLIVGGGLGGLTLAQCLRNQNVPFEIFERDTNPVSRSSGWAIGIHTYVPSLPILDLKTTPCILKSFSLYFDRINEGIQY